MMHGRGRDRSSLRIVVRKASSCANVTAARIITAPGNAVCTAASPSPRLRIYGDGEPASAPSPDKCTNRLVPASLTGCVRTGASQIEKAASTTMRPFP
jgi:hypothetical protein